MSLAAKHIKARQVSLMPTSAMVREAIQFIRDHEPPEGYFVAFSGGKDSIVTLALTRMAGVKHQAYYSATGIDPPEVVQFIRREYPDVKFIKPDLNFFEGVILKSPPLRTQRWCCDYLKETPSRKIELPSRLLGVRAEESAKRASRPRIDYGVGRKDHKLYKPIFHWKEYHIWDFIEAEGLAYPSLYDEGWDRIGCVICPFFLHKNQTKLLIHMERWPKTYHAFEKAVEKWWKLCLIYKGDRWLSNYPTWQEYLSAYYRGFE